MMKLVDAERPPRRLILGNAVPNMLEIYHERTRVWREWEPVSVAALDAAGHAETT